MARLAAPELYSRCQVPPHLLWVRENKEVVPGGNSSAAPRGNRPDVKP